MKIFGIEIKRAKKTRNYTILQQPRLTADWLVNNLTSDELLKWSLSRLRAFSRDFERNNDYMKNFLRKLENNVIGSKGIIFQSKVKLKDGSMDIRANSLIEDAFLRWAKSASVEGESLRDVCKIAIRSVARDGEIIIRKVKGYDNPFQFGLQLIEADHLDETLNQTLPDGRRIVMGIEKDQWGKPVAYWLYKKHPGDRLETHKERIRIPAEEIIHLYLKERPSQSRGIPWVVSSMLKLRMIGAYEEAEVTAARIASAKMGFYIQNSEASSFTGEQDEFGRFIEEVEPGIFTKLPPGWDFKAFDPGKPNSQYSSFVKSILRGISAGLGCNYNTLCNDLEGVNYSSLRSGSIEEREYWKDLQIWFIDNFLNKFFTDWLEMAILTNQLPFKISEIDKLNAPAWQPRRWDWVDPLNDVQAKLLELKNALTTRTRICAEKGIDFEDLLVELKNEKELMKKYDLTVSDVDEKLALILPGKNPEEIEIEGGKNGNSKKF